MTLGDADKTPVDHDAIVGAMAADAHRSVTAVVAHVIDNRHTHATPELRELLWALRAEVLTLLRWYGAPR